MAEIAAGAIAVEQVVMTGVEAGAVAAVAKPTMPLNATLTQIRVPADHDKGADLARSHHTVTTIGNNAYIFGGEHAGGNLCTADVHAISLPPWAEAATTSGTAPKTEATPIKAFHHTVYPPFPLQDASTGETLIPAPRKRHAAVARGNYLLIHGGVDASGSHLQSEDPAHIWLWDSTSLKWGRIKATVQIGAVFAPRRDHALLMDEKQQDFLVLYGGRTTATTTTAAAASSSGGGSEQQRSGAAGAASEAWLYDFNAVAWTELPSAPIRTPAASSNAAFVNGTLFVLSSTAGDRLGGSVYFLKLGHSATDREKALRWTRVDFPSNPLVPGPRVRSAGALVPVTTGMGRNYLVYMFGTSEEEEDDDDESPPEKSSATSKKPAAPKSTADHPLYSDIWSLQLPSDSFTPSSLKDIIRQKLPKLHSGSFTWAEMEVQPADQVEPGGKAHPGPLASFGAAPCYGGRGVVFWGGSCAHRQKQGDGWVLRIIS